MYSINKLLFLLEPGSREDKDVEWKRSCRPSRSESRQPGKTLPRGVLQPEETHLILCENVYSINKLLFLIEPGSRVDKDVEWKRSCRPSCSESRQPGKTLPGGVLQPVETNRLILCENVYSIV